MVGKLESRYSRDFMATLLWILVPGFTAAGSALLICFMMRCRMDEAIAREKGALKELQSALVVQRQMLEGAICDAKAEAKRAAFDEFLNDFRVEQRQYVRNSKLFFMNKRTLVLRERILFRNLPLSNWTEQTITLDESVGAPYPNSGLTIEAILGT
jgi:CRISPR/Cas system CMR subunit Cmr6 (Cas7 group RAMP superfamily)